MGFRKEYALVRRGYFFEFIQREQYFLSTVRQFFSRDTKINREF